MCSLVMSLFSRDYSILTLTVNYYLQSLADIAPGFSMVERQLVRYVFVHSLNH